MSGIARKAETLLAIPDSFRQTAMSFPAKIEEALALIETPKQAKNLLDQADTLEHYARRVKADVEILNSISYGRLKIIARLGELIAAPSASERGAKGGRGKKAPLPGKGALTDKTKSSYRKVHKNESKLATYYAQSNAVANEATLGGFIRFATGTEKAGRSAHVSANTGIPEWYTPKEYLDAARTVLGKIELDPASSEIAQQQVKARTFHTIDDDGLAQSWKGRTWMNPPYSADLVKQFIAKLCTHYEAGDIPSAIVLVNNATDTAWFQQAAKVASALCFPAGRVRFLDEAGKPGAPLQGQSLLYFGSDAKEFVAVFRSFGFCVVTA